MSITSKYQKTQGYWVYVHVLPTKEVYIGMSKQQPCRRWLPSEYKGNSLEPYIKRFGWDNIEHRVLIDNLTKVQAEQLEDQLIIALRMNGLCINKQRSGGHWRDNDEAYKEQKKVYREEHREQRLEYQKTYEKQRRSTPEGKIYHRVHAYNRYHPDLAIETPIEARAKYLETGYIPNYIKNDDLF